jgi:outer membrane receptor protein involved in Fe transport
VEAGWLWHNDTNASLMTTVYYRYLTNQITEVSRCIDGGVLLTTKENLDQSHNAGLELIWSYSINRWLSFIWNETDISIRSMQKSWAFHDTGILSHGARC